MSKEEFKICFNEWFDSIRNFIYYRCGNTEQATDIAQEAFMRLWQKQFKFHPQQTKSLLYKIAKELWISEHRKIQSAQKFQLSLTTFNTGNESEDLLAYKELKEKYEAALTQLPEKQREVFLMSRLEEMSYKEIAERLNLSLKAVEKRMSQALGELRKVLNHE
ncbi:MAG: sigma-70 family RNA polymerase sigma factor [Crocinitomicaceae bacterium]|nr:sigma-70 family RNA polymerase sigma factor [Crocinitomicaceae bacterium]